MCTRLHDRNVYGAIPVDDATILKEQHDDGRIVMHLLRYDKHKWIIFVDLKRVSLLLCKQKRYAEFPCIYECATTEH